MFPTATIVSPCFNHSRYVIESLESIKDQDYPNIQHIIIDDASNDDSRRLIEDWIERNEYPCEFIAHKTNKGLCYSLNESIERTKGDFWTSFGTDDVMMPHRTSVMAKYLIDHPDTMIVMSDAEYIDDDGNPTTNHGHQTVLRAALSRRSDVRMPEDIGTFESLFPGCYFASWFLRTSTFEKVGVFDESLRLEDWDMWLRISQHQQIPYIDVPLVKYRWHAGNASRQSEFMEQQMFLTLIKHYRAAMERLPDDAVEKVYLQFFHDLVATPKKFANFIALLKSPARPIVWKGMVEFLGNWRNSKV